MARVPFAFRQITGPKGLAANNARTRSSPLSGSGNTVSSASKGLASNLLSLELVTSSMTLAEALRRLQLMAAETVFQPESDGAIVQLLGPLEAAGMEFDQLWISGLSAANWPPAGRPSQLVSRDIQRNHKMPDAVPDDTLEYANRVLQRLLTSSEVCICSYPLTDGDTEQGVTGLLAGPSTAGKELAEDPGWRAEKLVGSNSTVSVVPDIVPAVMEDESLPND